MSQYPDRELPARISGDYQPSLRPVNEGAEKWLYRPISCLNHGFVYLVDYMGNDEAIAQAARVSYGAGTKKAQTDADLIRYLLRHAHTTPFEMVEFKFHCKMPIFVARQWIRHRMASVNEYSGRYSEMLNEFYLPEPEAIRKPSVSNRQGRGDDLTAERQRDVLSILKAEFARQYNVYQGLLHTDVAKELARIGLSVANYTQWYWKIDLHNLMHFLRLRLDSHAQHEIQVYGQAMSRIVESAVPIVYQAFSDYRLNAIQLSALDVAVIQSGSWPRNEEKVLKELAARFSNKRERDECFQKLKQLSCTLIKRWLHLHSFLSAPPWLPRCSI